MLEATQDAAGAAVFSDDTHAGAAKFSNHIVAAAHARAIHTPMAAAPAAGKKQYDIMTVTIRTRS